MQFDVRSAHTSGYARNRDAKRESEREREGGKKKRFKRAGKYGRAGIRQVGIIRKATAAAGMEK